MATTLFNSNIIEFASRMKDARTSAAIAGDTSANGGPTRYTSAQCARYENRSIRDLLLEWFQKLGPDHFEELFPEYVKTGSAITLVAGVVAKPVDAFIVLDLKKSDGTVKFRRLEQKLVQDVIMNTDGLIVPSPTSPVFYEENGNIVALGITSGNVIPRYIVTHQDIAVSTVSAGNGKIKTGGGTLYTQATQTIGICTMNVPFAAGDENKRIMFVDTSAGTVVYYARIASVISATSVSIYGDGLPPGDLFAATIPTVIVADNDITDLTLNQYWFGEVIERMIKFAMEDAKNFVK